MAERELELRYLNLSAGTKLLMQALPNHWLPSSVLRLYHSSLCETRRESIFSFFALKN